MLTHSIKGFLLPPLLVAFFFIAAANISAQTHLPCIPQTRLSLGMVPAISSNLIQLWSSTLNQRVQKKSCVSLSFSSAKDFKHYIHKANEGEFDVLAAPAHIASYLISHSGFKPVAFLVWESSYLYVVPNDSDISSLDHASKKVFALPDPFSEASILAQFEIDTHYNPSGYLYSQHYKKIIENLLSGKADVGVVLSPFYNGYKKHTTPKIRPIHEVAFPSHGMLIAAPHTTEAHRLELFSVLSSLESNTDLFWQSFESVSDSELKKLHRTQKQSVKALTLLLNQK